MRTHASTTSRLAAGSDPRILHSGPGQVCYLLFSHAESAAQAVTLYDGLNPSAEVLLKLHVPAGVEPILLIFPPSLYPRFSLGLTVDPGGCEVFVCTLA
jgi:hypothetical protein